MLATIRSAAVFGVEAFSVQVEVDVSPGLPSFTIVGLPDPSVRESRDRVRAAIRNSGFDFPSCRITINLAPADVRKVGASFDLPMAIGVLAAGGTSEPRHVDDWLVLGETSLDGALQPVKGVLPIAIAAAREGIDRILLPRENAGEAAAVTGLRVVPAGSLGEAVEALRHPDTAAILPRQSDESDPPATAADDVDFDDLRGQAMVRRALEIAAAGGHNVLMVGPPGSGKTMAARRIPSILPPLSRDETIEVSSIHSVAGLLPRGSGLLRRRPFRAPHHTISAAALVGGGTLPRPGEISLAHLGVLFLDEVPEFGRGVLEGLRQPIEEGCIVVSRMARAAVFPARFVLVGAMNPCPCGHLGHPSLACRCTPPQVERYRSRLSGPLRDRMDLTLDVPAVSPRDLRTAPEGESSATVRRRVVAARDRQARRFAAQRQRVNADLDGRSIRRHCALDLRGDRLLDAATRRLSLSARSHDRLLRVARTIADLAGSEHIDPDHLAEALLYRPVA